MRNFTRKQIWILIVSVLCISFCFLLYSFYFSYQFKHSYDTYAALSDIHVQAAYLPATDANHLRQELNSTLADVLATELSLADRLQRAERGLVLLKELEKQIDAMGDAGEAVSRELEALEARASGAERKEVVTLALERMRIIGDIRGLSYRASYHTAEIFNRIIADGGTLATEHVSELNSQIPLVEEQFDRRSGLYDELEAVTNKIQSKFSDIKNMQLSF